MSAPQQRREDRRLADFAQEPGMTHVKKPRLANLVRDGVVDLKRVCSPIATLHCLQHTMLASITAIHADTIECSVQPAGMFNTLLVDTTREAAAQHAAA